VTATRLAVLSALEELGGHPDVETVAAAARRRAGSVSTRAVYDILHQRKRALQAWTWTLSSGRKAITASCRRPMPRGSSLPAVRHRPRRSQCVWCWSILTAPSVVLEARTAQAGVGRGSVPAHAGRCHGP
jgi:hypothetical protein